MGLWPEDVFTYWNVFLPLESEICKCHQCPMICLMCCVCYQEPSGCEKEALSTSESCFRLLSSSDDLSSDSEKPTPEEASPALAQAGLPSVPTPWVTSLWNARSLHSWCEGLRGLAKEACEGITQWAQRRLVNESKICWKCRFVVWIAGACVTARYVHPRRVCWAKRKPESSFTLGLKRENSNQWRVLLAFLPRERCGCKRFPWLVQVQGLWGSR